MRKLMCLLLICSNIAIADPVVTYLPKDTQAPFTGFLFTPDKEKELRLMDQKVTYLQLVNTSLTNINKAQDDEINVLQKRMDIRDKELSMDHSWLTSVGYFIAGALVTGLIAQAVYRTR